MTAFLQTKPSRTFHQGSQGAQLIKRFLPMIIAVTTLLIVCLTARDGVYNLYSRWRYEDEYGYGFLLWALVPFLLWKRWPEMLTTSGTRWPGVLVVVLAQVCALLAVLGESYFIEQIALIVSIMGVGLILFRTGSIKILLPITFLCLLTVPLPYTLQAMLTIKLQLISTDIGVAIIRLLGIPVYVEGNVIDLGVYKLQVVEACSGLRYLLPLTAISFLVAYLYRGKFWKKVFVVISAVPLTILLNSFRIAVTAILVNSFGTRMAEGFLHEFEGLVVFLLGVLLLGLEIFALEGFQPIKMQDQTIVDHSVSSPRAELLPATSPLILVLLICAATFSITASIAAAHESIPAPSRKSFAEFPNRIDGWNGKQQPLDADVVNALKDTDSYMGDFTKRPGIPEVNLFVAYYASLSRGAAIHSPRVCLPGSGWEFASFQERNFDDLQPETPGTYYRVIVQKGEQQMLMYYWYQQRERRTASEFGMKYYLLRDSLFKARNDGALVRLMTKIDNALGTMEADARLHSFARAAFSELPSYLPE